MRGTRVLAAALALSLICGCAAFPASRQERYEVSYLDLFDTVTVIMGYAETGESFRRTAQGVHDSLEEYHRLYDAYNSYAGVANIKTVNDSAGGEPVKVDRRIIELLMFCRRLWEMTEGRVDVTLGPVLKLWHDARERSIADPENAYVPDTEALREAKAHCGFDRLEIDEENLTVRLTDPGARLDVGAVAKGYAAGRVAERAPEGLLINVGGNICATGSKPDGSPWIVGIQDPEGGGEDYLETVSIFRTSVVTSGDYQRYYTVNGVSYHHIIDPETLMPGGKWRAVTVLCEDSGLADGLSTALFLMDREDGERLLRALGAEGLWVGLDGGVFSTEGFFSAQAGSA